MTCDSNNSIAFAISMGFLSLVITLVMIANPIADEDKISVSQILNHIVGLFKESYDSYWYFMIPFGIIIIVLPFRFVIHDVICSIEERRKTSQQNFSKVSKD